MTDIKEYYDITPLIEYARKINCPWLGCVGGKGNGKTYSIILYALKEFVKTRRCMRYLRRYDVSIKPKAISSLCKAQRQNLINLTGGKYNDFMYYQNKFYLIRMEDGVRVDKCSEPFMICSALNSLSAFTGADEGECSMIFYDEVMSRKENELPDEYLDLMTYHDNCIRNRTDYFCPTILVGNTFTRHSIIMSEFGVDLYSLVQGEITVVRNKDKIPTFVMEYCADTLHMQQAGNSYYSRFDNEHIKMIYKGTWTVGNYPHIRSNDLQCSRLITRIKIISPAKVALSAELRMIDGKHIFLYVCRYMSDDTPHFCTMLHKTQIFDTSVYNYFPQTGVFRHYLKCIMTRMTFFSSCEIGEYFRDFLRSFPGCDRVKNVYQ